VKKYVLAIAAIAAIAPAGTAYAGADYKIDNHGPSVSLGGLLEGDGSGGGPIEILGQEIDGLQSQGSARHKFETDTTQQAATFKEELKIKTSGLENVEDGDPVVYFSLSEILGNFLGGGNQNLGIGLPFGRELPLGEIDGDKAELDYKYVGEQQQQPLPLSHCGDIILGLPLSGQGLNLGNLLISSVSEDGDVATALGGSIEALLKRQQVFCPIAEQIPNL
jgi:hypothetical protein